MKVSDLEGAALDAAVAKAEGLTVRDCGVLPDGSPAGFFRVESFAGWQAPFHYSSDWALGGPIIESERITIVASSVNGEPVEWSASVGAYTHYIDEQLPFGTYYDGEPHGRGPTPLVAAMRAFVVSRLGDEVDLP